MFEAPQEQEISIGLTPLIDIVFILLIFVVLAANFERVRGLKVALPEADNTQAAETKPLHITVTKAGKIVVQGQEVAATLLLSRLRALRKKHKALLLRADSKSAFQHAVTVLDKASVVGFESVSIATKRGEAP